MNTFDLCGARRLAGLTLGTLAALPAWSQVGAGPADVARIYQQRTADGRVVLTDRPNGGVLTERSWQLAREDPAAARQRAERVEREARAVSERVQRRIDDDERRVASIDFLRQRVAQADALREAALARADSESGPAIAIVERPLRFGAQRPGSP